VLPRRWVVDRTFALIFKNRRLDRGYEQLTAAAETLKPEEIAISMDAGAASNQPNFDHPARHECPSLSEEGVLLELRAC
jgi:hypothetical protein